MYATSPTSQLSPRPGAAAATRPLSVIDTTGTCGCGQDLDTRHPRCTRCGR